MEIHGVLLIQERAHTIALVVSSAKQQAFEAILLRHGISFERKGMASVMVDSEDYEGMTSAKKTIVLARLLEMPEVVADLQAGLSKNAARSA